MDVENWMDKLQIGPSVIIGHSMGAKTAMAMSFRRPDLVSALIPVDNSPVGQRLSKQFVDYIAAFKEIQSSQIKTQKEAFQVMGKYERSLTVQNFLLSNFKKIHKGTYAFRIPVDTLGDSLENLGAFPFSADDCSYSGPTLFIRGTQSN